MHEKELHERENHMPIILNKRSNGLKMIEEDE